MLLSTCENIYTVIQTALKGRELIKKKMMNAKERSEKNSDDEDHHSPLVTYNTWPILMISTNKEKSCLLYKTECVFTSEPGQVSDLSMRYGANDGRHLF